MPWGVAAAAVGAVGSIAAGSMGSSAAKDAANTQAAAGREATAVQREMYETSRGDLAPYRNFGGQAVNRLGQIFYGAPAAVTSYTPAGAAPAAAPAPAPAAVPAPVAAGAGQLASMGFQPNGQLPPGYSIQQVGGGEGEGPARKVIVGEGGGIISELPNVPMSDTAEAQQAQRNAAVTILTSQGLMGQAPAAAPAPAPVTVTTPSMAPGGGEIVPGALPGANSAVTPYAPPNGGVFDPIGGNLAPGWTPAGGTQFREFTFNPTTEQLENTPGFKFQLANGLRAVQSSNAAKGLGLSGASLKAGADYANGLANTTWKDYYNAELGTYNANAKTFGDNFTRDNQYYTTNYNAWTGNWDRQRVASGINLDNSIKLNDQYYKYNVQPLVDFATLGGNAAAQSGNQALRSGESIGNNLTGIGNAQAAGTIGAANSMMTGMQAAANAPTNYLMMDKYLKNGSNGSGNGGVDYSNYTGGTWHTY